MQEFNIEVGDRVTYKSKDELEYQKREKIVINEDEIIKILSCIKEEQIQVLKIERIGSNGWYTVYEKEKELLTEEEKELLQVMIKNMSVDIEYIKKSGDKVIFIKNNSEEAAQIIISDVILDFNNLEYRKLYLLSELGLNKEYCECCETELTKENKALNNMCNECKYGLEY